MSTEETTNLADLKYGDLQKLAKERGVDASGTKEVLLARLQETDGTATKETEGDAPEETKEPEAKTPAANEAATPADTGITPQQERVEQTKADQALRSDVQKMKDHLAKQRKVSIMIPFEAGEKPDQARNITFHVNLNGYAMDLPRGKYIDVPEQVADVIKERLESEGKIGAEWRIDRDESKAEALS